MRYAHVIVDGFSVLHRDAELKRLLDRQPALARHQLVRKAEAIGLQLAEVVTVVFDGRAGENDAFAAFRATVIFSTAHQSADSLIERMVHAAPEPARILVVTSDRSERELVMAAGAATLSAGDFLAAGGRAARESKRARPGVTARPANRMGDYFPSGGTPSQPS